MAKPRVATCSPNDFSSLRPPSGSASQCFHGLMDWQRSSSASRRRSRFNGGASKINAPWRISCIFLLQFNCAILYPVFAPQRLSRCTSAPQLRGGRLSGTMVASVVDIYRLVLSPPSTIISASTLGCSCVILAQYCHVWSMAMVLCPQRQSRSPDPSSTTWMFNTFPSCLDRGCWYV